MTPPSSRDNRPLADPFPASWAAHPPGFYQQEVFLDELSAVELIGKLAERLALLANQSYCLFDQGPRGILVLSQQVKAGQVATTCSQGGPDQTRLPFSLGLHLAPKTGVAPCLFPLSGVPDPQR